MERRHFLLQSAALTLAATGLRCNASQGLTGPSQAVGRKEKHRVAIIGCGRMGQYYADVYRAMPDTELVAIAEWNPERRKVVGERFGVKALFKDVHGMLKDTVPDIAAIITPTKFMKEAVIACAEAGVKGVSTDKPIAARLSDADAMVSACKERGVVFAGGNLQRAKWNVQEAARQLSRGKWGTLQGASIHSFGGEISGGGCQHLSVLRLFAKSEVQEVIAWGTPLEALAPEKDDAGLIINGLFYLGSGLEATVFGQKTPYSGVEVWTDDALVRWNWNEPQVFQGYGWQGRPPGSGPPICSQPLAGLRQTDQGDYSRDGTIPLVRGRLPGHLHSLLSGCRGQGTGTVHFGPRPAAGPGDRHCLQAVGPAGQSTGQAAPGRPIPGPLPPTLPLAGRRRHQSPPVGRRSCREHKLILQRPDTAAPA